MERWFAEITRKRISHGSFRSVRATSTKLVVDITK
jgi:hypothetical protein